MQTGKRHIPKTIAPVAARIIGLTMAAALMLSPAPVIADTTFVSGAVSGEWTRDGNPFIVEDSTWVPEGESLELREGVEVFFEEGQGLHVFGTMNATGTEEDSVRFESQNDSATWLGITLIGSPERHLFDYCVQTGAPDGITLGDGIRLTIGHSLIVGEYKAIGGPREGGDSYGGNIVIENSVLLGTNSIRKMLGPSLTFTNSIAYNIWADGGGITATGCDFYDGIRVFYSSYSDCRFLLSEGVEFAYVILGGTLENCYSEAQIRLFGTPSRISHLESSSGVYGDADLAMDSSVITYMNVDADGFGRGFITLNNCTITDRMSVSATQRIDIFKCTVFGRTQMYGDGSIITVDSSEFHARFREGEENDKMRIQSNSRNPSILCLTRSLVTMPMAIWNMDSMSLENNTFCFYYRYSPYETMDFYQIQNKIMRSNIFYAANDSLTLFSGGRIPVFQYNIIYGFERDFYDERYAFEIDSTNLRMDPLFVSLDSSDFHLLADSPCIDAGDPDSPRDPDGTMADIGAYFYPQPWSVSRTSPEYSSAFELVSFYPNPCNASVTFVNPTLVNVDYKIIDLSGRVIAEFSSSTIVPLGRKTFDIRNLSTGTYIVLGKQNGRTVNRKLIVQK